MIFLFIPSGSGGLPPSKIERKYYAAKRAVKRTNRRLQSIGERWDAERAEADRLQRGAG